MVIDSHQHFWNYSPVKHAWINDEMAVLQRDFLPQDLAAVYADHSVDGCVAVQADQSEDETNFLLELSENNSFIKGVVGWVDLRADNIDERLAHFSAYDKLVGFRHVVQEEPDPAFMLQPSFQRGISLLDKHGLAYDILIFPTQLEAALQTVKNFPNQRFVIDHIAKPYIKAGKIEQWEKHMRAIAAHDNVWCKVSGMVTEADWANWKADDFKPYLDVVFEAFGTDRIMYGSDWPVCLLAGNYGQVKGLVNDYTSGLSDSEKTKVWGQNALDFYNI